MEYKELNIMFVRFNVLPFDTGSTSQAVLSMAEGSCWEPGRRVRFLRGFVPPTIRRPGGGGRRGRLPLRSRALLGSLLDTYTRHGLMQVVSNYVQSWDDI